MTSFKFCASCNIDKSSDDFHKNVRTRDGLASYCKVCAKEKYAEFYNKNSTRAQARASRSKKDNWEKTLNSLKAYHEKNAERERVYRQNNRAMINETNKRYRDRHKGEIDTNATRKLRDANTPKWSDINEINYIYSLARDLTIGRGSPYEVDHIVPLRSPIVCGLHCEDNLRIIPQSLNRLKGNTYWPNMPN